jgi:phospholipase D1/2
MVAHADFTVDVCLYNVPLGQRVELSFLESDATDDGQIRPDRVLATIAGVSVPPADKGAPGCSFLPTNPVQSPPAEPGAVRVAFRFPRPARLDEGGGGQEAPLVILRLDDAAADMDEGDWWEVAVRADNLGCTSPILPLARVRRQLEGGGATYDWHDGHDIELFHDGSSDAEGTSGPFAQLREAITNAEHFVFVADWSFQPLFRPTRIAVADAADSIGALLVRKATQNPRFIAAIHTWDHTNAGAPDPQNDGGDAGLDVIARGMKLPRRPPNLLWRASSRTGFGWSHHQKFVVLDGKATDGRRELEVYFGGLDLTKGRFDWPAHVISSKDRRAWPFLQEWRTVDGSLRTNDWYNAEFQDPAGNAPTDLPRQPWHDIHGVLRGPAAWDFVREFVGRWMHDPSSSLAASDAMGDDSVAAMGRVWDLFKRLRREKKVFVQQHERRPGVFCAQVYRSMVKEHWGPPRWHPRDDEDRRAAQDLAWRLKDPRERSIQDAYLRTIDQAERFIYIENQYLIGSGRRWGKQGIRNEVPERLVARILERARAKKPFHVYVVTPMFPEGNPVGTSVLEVRRNEWLTWQYMVRTLHAELGARWSDYLTPGFLANWSSLPRTQWKRSRSRAEILKQHQRYMIYVHSKLMIVDDRYAIFGSANLNERSLSGDRDTEVAVGLWPARGHDGKAIEKLRKFRISLWSELFGEPFAGMATPETAECVRTTQATGDRNYRNFRQMSAHPRGFLCRWPFQLVSGTLEVSSKRSLTSPEGERHLPDAPDASAEWLWRSPGSDLTWKLAE